MAEQNAITSFRSVPRPGSERNNGKPGFGVCPYCKQWQTITDGHAICRKCEGYEK